jgi:hypothetical protein
MRVARKLRLPKIVAKDGDATLAVKGFFAREGSPEKRSDAEHIEKIAGDFGFTEGPTTDKDGNVYFVDQNNNKTSVGPAGWGNSATCWIRAKNGQC